MGGILQELSEDRPEFAVGSFWKLSFRLLAVVMVMVFGHIGHHRTSVWWGAAAGAACCFLLYSYVFSTSDICSLEDWQDPSFPVGRFESELCSGPPPHLGEA